MLIFVMVDAIDVIIWDFPFQLAMGPTDPAKAEAGTIRGDFGLDIERNTIHGSDSVVTAEEEIKLFFSEDEFFNYSRTTES